MRLRESTFYIESLLTVGVICIGFAAIFVRLAGISGTVASFYRLLIASSALVPIWLVKGDRSISRRMAIFAVLSGICFGCDLGMWSTALFHTRAATATLLVYLAPVWVAIAARVFLKERIRNLQWLGTATALSGMVVIVGLRNLLEINLGFGNSIAIFASFFYAGYLLFAQLGRSGTGTFTFTTISVVSSMVTLLVACLVRGEQMTGFSMHTWVYLFALGLVTHVTGWLSINYALGHLKASIVSVTLLGQPMVTAIAAIPILGESLAPAQIAGGMLVLAGIYLVNRRIDPVSPE